ncbi:MAG: hypothetical protein R2932_18205 [Caldilineaceae bacterium]
MTMTKMGNGATKHGGGSAIEARNLHVYYGDFHAVRMCSCRWRITKLRH